MKKVLAWSILAAAVPVLSGCTLSSPVPGVTQKFSFSKSISITRDGGKTWNYSNTATASPRVSDIDPLALAFDPVDQNIVYAGLRSGGIMRTTDGGATWEFLTFSSEKVYGLAVDESNPNTVYASAVVNGRGKIFKNETSGNGTWTELYTAATNGPLVIYLTVDKHNSGTLYVSTSDNQILKSTDSGLTWRNIYSAGSPAVKIALDAKDSQLIYLLTKNGDVFYTTDGGDKFSSLSEKITTSGVTSSAFAVMETDPGHGKWIYLAGKNGIIRSKDGGDKWETVLTLNNPQNSPVGALAINPRNSQEIIYGAAQATYKSVDEGKTWSTSQFDTPKFASLLEYDPLDPNVIYAVFTSK